MRLPGRAHCAAPATRLNQWHSWPRARGSDPDPTCEHRTLRPDVSGRCRLAAFEAEPGALCLAVTFVRRSSCRVLARWVDASSRFTAVIYSVSRIDRSARSGKLSHEESAYHCFKMTFQPRGKVWQSACLIGKRLLCHCATPAKLARYAQGRPASKCKGQSSGSAP